MTAKAATLRARAARLKTETVALFLACRDPRVPWYAKVLGAAIVGYALSPIDLIPDFVPVLGYLDDLILVPAGIALLLRLIPPGVMADMRERAGREFTGPKGTLAAVTVVAVWIIVLGLVFWLCLSRLIRR